MIEIIAWIVAIAALLIFALSSVAMALWAEWKDKRKRNGRS